MTAKKRLVPPASQGSLPAPVPLLSNDGFLLTLGHCRCSETERSPILQHQKRLDIEWQKPGIASLEPFLVLVQ